MQLEPGTKLGAYEIIEPIGEGGMGEVYRARDTKLARDVAIKLLHAKVANDAARLSRFKREAQVLAALNHPNIASIYGLEEAEGAPFLVLELVEGEDLSERLQRGRLPVDEALDCARQIAEGVEAAHEKGIVHRDLKPGNVKLTPEGDVKVLDFGLAKALVEEPTPGAHSDLSQSPTMTRATAAGVILGTAGYMSPEQARGKSVDKRTDVWAFGCVLYEALTGQPAFGGESVTDVLAAVVKSEPDWKKLPDSVPWRVRDLLRRCLRKDPRRRLQDISAARLDLEDAIAEPAAPASGRSEPTRWPRIAVVAALAVGIVAGALGVWSTGTRTRAEVVRFAIELPPGKSLTPTRVAISADGRRIAYAAAAGGESTLHFRAIDELGSRVVPGTEGAVSPFFSPDGAWVGFFAGGRLQKVSWDGGVASTLCRIPSFFYGAFWSDDGYIVYSSSGLFRVSASGGEPELLGSTGGSSPNLLPGGESVLISGRGGEFGIYHFETGEWRVLGEGSNALYVTSGHIVYSHQNSLRAIGFNPATLEPRGNAVSILDGVGSMAVSNNGTLAFVSPLANATKLISVREHEREARALTEDRYGYYRPRFSPDGRRVAVTAKYLGIFTYDVERSTRIRVMGSGAWSSEWTPDGNKIAFYWSDASVSGDLFWKSADGTGEAESLLTREHQQWPTSFSPGGDWLAFSELHPETSRDIWMLPLRGDRSPTPFLVTAANERMARFSPDGRFVAFVSDDSGRDEVYVLPFPGPGPKASLSPGGGTAPMWSRDGRRLFYQRAPQMLAVDIRYGPTLSASAPTVLFEGIYSDDSDRDFTQYDVGPEDVGFVMAQADDTPEQRRIHVVLNWFEELKRLAPAN